MCLMSWKCEMGVRRLLAVIVAKLVGVVLGGTGGDIGAGSNDGSR